MWGFFYFIRSMPHHFLVGGTLPHNICHEEPKPWAAEPKRLRYKHAPKQRPLHKTRFR